MSVETQLRNTLHRQAARTPPDAGDLQDVRERGRRRRRLRTGGAGLAGATALAVVVVLVGTIGQPRPTITPIGDGLKDAAIVLCDSGRCPVPTDGQLENLERDLTSDLNVASYELETSEQTRDRFARALDHRPGLVDSLNLDALPQTIGLRVEDVTALDQYVDRVGVDRVIVSEGLPLPLTHDQIAVELLQWGEATDDLEILHVDVVGQSLVMIAERAATARERQFTDHARRGLLYTWKPDPDAISSWIPDGGINAPIGPDGWTATADLDDGTQVLAWGSITDPTAHIELPGGLLRRTTTYGVTTSSGLAVIQGAGEPKIVTQ